MWVSYDSVIMLTKRCIKELNLFCYVDKLTVMESSQKEVI